MWLLSSIIIKSSNWKPPKVNLGDAAIFSPMYGILFCIRSVIGDKNPGPQIIRELFNKCLEISELIAPILNSESPEGYLGNSGKETKVTAQILLLCSWRTSKEISLIFGQICQFAPDSILEETSKCFTKQLGEVKVCTYFAAKICITKTHSFESNAKLTCILIVFPLY